MTVRAATGRPPAAGHPGLGSEVTYARGVDLRLVEYFVAVVDHGGVTRAAQALFIAQPSLSQAIRSLEREIGADLFDRTGRGLELTAAGRAFEVAARRVVRDVAVAKQRMDDIRGLRTGRLYIAALADVTLDRLPQMVKAFRDAHPGVEVRIADPGHAGGVVDAVRQGRAELGFTTLPVKADALTTVRLAPQRMVLAMTPDLARDLPDPVPQSMLGQLPLVRSMEDRLGDIVVEPDAIPPASNAALRSGFRQLTWELVMLGAGLAVLPESIAESQLSGVVLLALEPEIVREVGVVFREGQLSPAAEAFLGSALAPPSGAGASAREAATSTKARAAVESDPGR